MRLRSFLSLLALVARPVVSQEFVYPPPFVATTDFSQNIVMVEGEYKVIQWSVSNPNQSRISVTMFQLNGTQFLPGDEYIIQNAPYDTLSTGWVVNTAKNLTLSPMFYMNLFFEGQTTSLTNSHYFNITTASTTSSTSSSSTSSSTSSQTSASSAKTSTTGSPATTSSPPATSSPAIVASSGLSGGAKAGIAVGVIGAALLGVLAGWLILGRMMKRKNAEPPAPAHPPVQTSYYDPVKIEMQPQQYQQYQQYHSAEVSGEPIPPVRYELSPDARYELPPGVRQ